MTNFLAISSIPAKAMMHSAFLPSTLTFRRLTSPNTISHIHSRPILKPRNARRLRLRASLSPILALSVPPAALPCLTAATPFALTFLLISAATIGILSTSTSWGKALSAPVVTTLLTLVLSNILPLPSAHPVYSFVTSYLVPLAVPLLLFNADLRRVLRDTTRLVIVFITGSMATILGTLLAWRLIPLQSILGAQDAWKVAAALCARHIGGAVNYVAVAEATSAGSEAVAAAFAADNIVVALYFILLLFLARGVAQPKSVGRVSSDKAEMIGEDVAPSAVIISVPDVAVALSLSSGMCAIGFFVDAALPFHLGPIPVITAIALSFATAFPNFFSRYRGAAAAVGVFFMQIFFAATGVAGSLANVAKKAPLLLLFSTVQLAVHLGTFVVVGALCRFEMSEILIASNANVGGPTTAAGMAAAKDWDRLLIPALLIGVFGYSIATFVSLAVGHFLLKPV